MNEVLTRPIPDFAIEALKVHRLAEARRNAEFGEKEQTGLQSSVFDLSRDDFVAVQRSDQKASPWRVARDTAAVTALTLLMQTLPTHTPPTTGDFLVVLADSGVSRPMLDMSEVTSKKASVVCSRAAASMQPMELSKADAEALRACFRRGSGSPDNQNRDTAAVSGLTLDGRKMAHELRTQPFCASLLTEVQDFSCGDEPWQDEVTQWIKSTTIDECATKSIAQRNTQVWLYRTADGELVGYGSLGQSKWRWPPPKGAWETISIIPSFGVQSKYQGEPKEDPPEARYASRIMSDLIGRAHAQGNRLLGLFVHPKNARAIGFYKRIGFLAMPDTGGDYLRMYLILR